MARQYWSPNHCTACNGIPPLGNHIIPLRNHIIPLRKHIIPLRNHIIPLRNHIIPLRNHIIPLRNHIIPLRNHIIPLRNHIIPQKNHRNAYFCGFFVIVPLLFLERGWGEVLFILSSPIFLSAAGFYSTRW